MDTYTYSEARQNLAGLLDRAKKAGAVHIRRRGGQMFQITPITPQASPLDVGFVDCTISRGDLVKAVREGRSSRKY